MKTKILLSFVLVVALVASFAGGASAAKKSKSSASSPLNEVVSSKAHVQPSPLMYEGFMASDCQAINSEAVILQGPDTWGATYYDEQQIGSMGRMIAVGAGGHKHMVFHETSGPYGTTFPRYVTYNCKDPLGSWLGPTWVDGGANINAGYANIVVFQGGQHIGREVVLYHTTAETPEQGSKLAVGDTGFICSGYFTNLYDLPDKHDPSSDYRGWWPKGCIVYVTSAGQNYFHIVTTENKLDYDDDLTIAYQRCELQDTTLICRSPVNRIYTRQPNTAYPGPLDTVAVIDTVKTISAVAVNSPVSYKVAIVYTKHREDVTWNNDIFYIESTTNGVDWLDGTQWPPAKYNVTDYSESSGLRAYTDVAACYDYNNNLHIVWNAHYYDSASGEASMSQISITGARLQEYP